MLYAINNKYKENGKLKYESHPDDWKRLLILPQGNADCTKHFLLHTGYIARIKLNTHIVYFRHSATYTIILFTDSTKRTVL